MTALRPAKILTGLAAALVVSCTSQTHNPLVGDPMADVNLEQAERISRTVTDPSTGSWQSKQQEAEVLQIYRTATPARFVKELIARATRAGWAFDTSLQGLNVGQLATKRIDGATATLAIAEGDDANQVVLRLARQPTE